MARSDSDSSVNLCVVIWHVVKIHLEEVGAVLKNPHSGRKRYGYEIIEYILTCSGVYFVSHLCFVVSVVGIKSTVFVASGIKPDPFFRSG